MEALITKELNTVLPYFLKYKNVWANYDSEADTLYLHFKKPNHAESSEMTDNEIIIRYDENAEVIGFTILNASQRRNNS
ncbi:MAG: DUF2283 domain-containing protein [Saprospiraceae bacterium]|nr:DUF2283 domain-containing protein [Saprospiraceae bacterium]